MGRVWKHAIVGGGVVGEWHARVLRDLPSTELVAVCDIDVPKATKHLEKNNLAHVPIFSDLRQMLDKCDAEVIHICTPSGDHLDPALLSMDAGRHVICEKPIEITPERVDVMIDRASKRNVKLAGIFQNRWNRANAAIKKAADDGKFGRITYGGCHTPWFRTDQYYRDGGWRGTWKLDGGGAIMNQSVHAVDLIQWIVGPIKQVSAYASSLIHPEIEVEDTLVASVQFESGAYGVIMGATSMWPGSSVRIEVGGAKGTAVSENSLKFWRFQDESEQASTEQIERVNGATRFETTGGGSNPLDVPTQMHMDNVSAILEAWESGSEAPTHGPEARKAVAIIKALYDSAKKGGVPVRV